MWFGAIGGNLTYVFKIVQGGISCKLAEAFRVLGLKTWFVDGWCAAVGCFLEVV